MTQIAPKAWASQETAKAWLAARVGNDIVQWLRSPACEETLRGHALDWNRKNEAVDAFIGHLNGALLVAKGEQWDKVVEALSGIQQHVQQFRRGNNPLAQWATSRGRGRPSRRATLVCFALNLANRTCYTASQRRDLRNPRVLAYAGLAVGIDEEPCTSSAKFTNRIGDYRDLLTEHGKALRKRPRGKIAVA